MIFFWQLAKILKYPGKHSYILVQYLSEISAIYFDVSVSHIAGIHFVWYSIFGKILHTCLGWYLSLSGWQWLNVKIKLFQSGFLFIQKLSLRYNTGRYSTILGWCRRFGQIISFFHHEADIYMVWKNGRGIKIHWTIIFLFINDTFAITHQLRGVIQLGL